MLSISIMYYFFQPYEGKGATFESKKETLDLRSPIIYRYLTVCLKNLTRHKNSIRIFHIIVKHTEKGDFGTKYIYVY